VKFSSLFKNPALGIGVIVCVVALLGAAWIFVRTQPTLEHLELAEIQQSWTFDEYEDFFSKLAREKNAVYAFDVLRYADIPSTIDIHRIAHNIGYVHFEQKGLRGIYDCTTDFRNACEHAIVVQALITLGTQALYDVAKVCSEGPGGLSAYVHCFHGVGHGLMAYLNYDYEETVGTCKKVYDIAVSLRPEVTTELLWHECVGGATMELTQGEHDKNAWEKAKRTYMPAADILMPCNADFMPEEVRTACYAYLKPRFLEAAGATRGVASPQAYPKALSYCKLIPEDRFGSRDGCYAGFGAAFAYFANGDARTLEHMSESAIVNVHAWCAFAEDARGQRICDLSALDNIFWGGQSESPSSVLYCRLAPDTAIKESCFTTLISYAQESFQNQQKLTAFCRQLPSEYREACFTASPHAP
jgi:hypothetical protein